MLQSFARHYPIPHGSPQQNVACSFVLLGAYTLTKRKGWSLTFGSRMRKRPFLSTFVVLSSNSKEISIEMRTPLLCFVPCEKNISPFHWDFPTLSTSWVLYGSWKKNPKYPLSLSFTTLQKLPLASQKTEFLEHLATTGLFFMHLKLLSLN